MQTNLHPYVSSLLSMMNESPCNFLATAYLSRTLEAAGYRRWSLDAAIDARAGERFYFTKNDSAIFAIKMGKKPVVETGFKLIAAHSDSPCFRIKPAAEIPSEGGIVRLNTEVYGGPILYTWFDRSLSIAGRVIFRGKDALHPETRLIHIRRPLLSIVHLAIHFNRAVNDGNPLSKQRDMLPIIAQVNSALEADGMLLRLVAEEIKVKPEEIIDFDLMLYDVQPATTYGLNNEFISCGRLDDLSMAHAAVTALLEATDDDATLVAAVFDNEETGSGTKQGAGSPVLANVLQRIVEAQGGRFDDFGRAIARSFMISADNAHAFHPNYAGKYDPTNHPSLGLGPCVKINANCKYMSDAHSAAVFKELCRKAKVNCQYFVNHSDVAGGSTLGNILTGQIDIEGVDVGSPLLAMHSARETASCADHVAMIEVMKQFFS